MKKIQESRQNNSETGKNKTRRKLVHVIVHFIGAKLLRFVRFCKDLKKKAGKMMNVSIYRYIINTIQHGKCFLRYLRSRCFCFRNQIFSLKVSIQPCRPKSDSTPSGSIWAQFSPKQLNQEAIPAHGGAHFSHWFQSALGNWTVLGLKGAKLDSQIGV